MRANPSIFTRFSALAVADITSRGLAFVATFLVVRAFKAEAFGQLGVATSVVTYALFASTCGLDVYAVRNVARLPTSIGATASTIMAIRSLLGVVAYLVLLGVCWSLPQLRPILPLVSLFGLTLFSGALSLIWVPQALQRTRALAAANVSTSVLYLLGVILVTTTHRPLWTVPLAQVTAEVIVALGLYRWLRRTAGGLAAPAKMAAWKRIVRDSAPIGGSSFLRTVALGSDLVLLRLFLVHDAQIGWYNGASRIFGLMMGLSSVYFTILFPRLSQKATQSRDVFRSEALGSIVRVLPFAGTALVGVAFLAPFALQLLFAPSFAGAANALRILGFAAFINLISNHFRNMLLATDRQHIDLRNSAITAVVHVACKAVLIPLVGIEGAAIGTLLGEMSGLLIGMWSTRADLRVAVAPVRSA